MAKFMGSLGQILGSVGGATFSHNRGGSYVKRRATPTNPNTLAQTDIRGILATLSSGWSSVDETDRLAWDNWAAANPTTDSLGNEINWSGHQAYIGLNSRLLLAGAAANPQPPITSGPPALLTLVPTFTEPADYSIVYTPTPPAAGNRLLIWWTRPGSPGQNPNFNQARILKITAAAAASPAAGFTNETLIENQELNIYAQIMDASGQVSPVLKARAVVEAGG